MDIQTLTCAAIIALLRRQIPPIGIHQQLSEGLKAIKEFSLEEAIAKEAGGEKTLEKAVSVLDMVTSTSTYQVLASWVISAQRTGKLSKVECACDDYDQGRFKLVIDDETRWEDKQLPSSLSMDFLGADVRGGKTVAVYGKSADGSAFSMWGDICGKEIV